MKMTRIEEVLLIDNALFECRSVEEYTALVRSRVGTKYNIDLDKCSLNAYLSGGADQNAMLTARATMSRAAEWVALTALMATYTGIVSIDLKNVNYLNRSAKDIKDWVYSNLTIRADDKKGLHTEYMIDTLLTLQSFTTSTDEARIINAICVANIIGAVELSVSLSSLLAVSLGGIF